MSERLMPERLEELRRIAEDSTGLYFREQFDRVTCRALIAHIDAQAAEIERLRRVAGAARPFAAMAEAVLAMTAMTDPQKVDVDIRAGDFRRLINALALLDGEKGGGEQRLEMRDDRMIDSEATTAGAIRQSSEERCEFCGKAHNGNTAEFIPRFADDGTYTPGKDWLHHPWNCRDDLRRQLQQAKEEVAGLRRAIEKQREAVKRVRSMIDNRPIGINPDVKSALVQIEAELGAALSGEMGGDTHD